MQGDLPPSGGTTNGAPMRALPAGWATPLDDPDRRRRIVIELTRATHPDPDALVAACVVAACASWAVEAASSQLLLDVAIGEETQARAVGMGGDTDTVAAITGGLLGARLTATEVHAELPWHAAVQLPAPVLIAGTSSALATIRTSAHPA